MKKLFALILPIFLLFACTKPQQEQTITENQTMENENKKVLVVFFSKTGENYGVGNIKIGNTHKVAMEIARQTNGTLFEIKPVKPYPDGYQDCVDVAKEEKTNNTRPAIKGKVENMAQYDIIYLGYPNWWGDAPMPVYTFLESYDLTGKTIYPFATHEGSGLGRSEEMLKEVLPKSTLKEGLAIYGHIAQNDAPFVEKTVRNWLNK